MPQAPRITADELKTLPLRAKQERFALMIAHLIVWAFERGYTVTLGDAYRDPRVFGEQGQRKGYGRLYSAHKHRLAVDLNLFRGGHYLSDTESHAELGAQWESMGGSWGGRFEDGNHYSIEHGGVK